VIGGGFGAPELLARAGIERRVYTAGENKARLDPFSPAKPEDVAFVKELMGALHERFKQWVRARRGARLLAPEAAVFDGGWMLGDQALAAGLIDALGDLDGLVRELGGEKTRVDIHRPRKRGLLSRLPRMIAEAALDVLDERRLRPDVSI
jgi:ClpP class serine protease